jgi:hypothetical protein
MAADEQAHALVVAGLAQRVLLEAASQELDGPTLRALAQQEAAELGLVFRARGLPADLAERHAAALVTGHEQQPVDGADAANVGVGGTDGTGSDVIGSAMRCEMGGEARTRCSGGVSEGRLQHYAYQDSPHRWRCRAASRRATQDQIRVS